MPCTTVIRRPTTEILDPLPPEIITHIVARRVRISPEHAATVVQLAGRGAQPREARQ